MHHLQAIIQVAAERARFDRRLQVAIGRRDQAHIDRDGRVAAEPFDLALLQHAQQFHLNQGRDVADFVQEQRAAVRRFELADAVGICARVRAFDRAE
jgi:hypothetical protein